MLWQLLLTRDLCVHVSRGEPLVLALCVWSVYVADRVLDAARPRMGGWEPARKVFYRKHLRMASVVGLCLLSSILPLAYCVLRRSTFHAGLILAVPLVFYLVFVHLAPARWRAYWPREAVVACVFAAGTFLAVWTGNNRNVAPLWVPALLFALLCWANCSAIETWEWQRNIYHAEEAPSGSTRWAARYLLSLALAIAGLSAILGHTALAPAGFSAAAFSSGMALALLAACRSYLPMNGLRVAADLALCTPLPVIVFALLK